MTSQESIPQPIDAILDQIANPHYRQTGTNSLIALAKTSDPQACTWVGHLQLVDALNYVYNERGISEEARKDNFRNSYGFTNDAAQTYHYSLTGARAGNSMAQKDLGIMYEEGINVGLLHINMGGKDLAKAAAWYHLAAMNGDSDAGTHEEYLRMTMNTDDRKRIDGLFDSDPDISYAYGVKMRDLARAHDVGAMAQVGLYMEHGTHGFKKDQKAALYYEQEAAAHGNADARLEAQKLLEAMRPLGQRALDGMHALEHVTGDFSASIAQTVMPAKLAKTK